ncbi:MULTISPECIES: LacI family DNA-binding transcriptional regulator [unclassified Cryobacterium]|uniref:LacI family DNA-binding transcriptional regulator n=1 Tax=unclassified Cryobacterium TaxID=2649013 RepID=UPI00106CD913|nr:MULTISPECIES: LacI family DNA-binding transcriptional regulator [unclassified Cryobacterium]TFB96407.1 LacI family transcriptional regulator [Cryobacterium sp. MDB2-A-1]TFC10495.1 LacI family transcriptional regulator [Cryobacterium sp. MDB2-33-2]TFC12691.1 LacI family transcriptional regulator [Cryobacterium sp. MDB2-A-2]TFC17085.1 LacI family transcriptional regulator [Cryobacterium sp. MDB2-10]TFC23194.1 LacI family transcriptional regulator [Cryobacterium sp. MDB1-18-2]
MAKSPTIRDVAGAADVSISVVSRVLNDTGPVAPGTRARVVDAIERLRYRPRAAARELSQGQALTIGLVLADLTNPFFARLADRIVWEARARGAQVVLMTTQEDPHLEAESLDTLLDRSVGGVIATPTGGNVDAWERLRAVGVNVVFVDRTVAELADTDVVSIENANSAETATAHLVSLGHTRIALISGPSSTSTGRSRTGGYQRALDLAGIARDPELVRAVPFRGDAGGDAVAGLLALENPPTALVVANTAQVQSCMRRLAQLSVSIPDDLSVIVFDDGPWTELVSPPLSIIRQPIDMLALHSVELVLGRMQNRLPSGGRAINVRAEFVQRSSCTPPKKYPQRTSDRIA